MSTTKSDDKDKVPSRLTIPKIEMSQTLLVRRYIPMAIVFVTAVLTITDYYVSYPPINTGAADLQQWVTMIMGFLMVLGTIGVYLRHIRNVRRRGVRWPISAYGIGLLTFVIVLGTGLGLNSSTYNYFYNYFYSWPDLSIAGLHAFGTMTCILFAVRCRNLEEILFAFGALFGYLTLSTVGAAASLSILQIGQWINDQPFMAATRVITIVMGIGMIGSGLRSILARRGSGTEWR